MARVFWQKWADKIGRIRARRGKAAGEGEEGLLLQKPAGKGQLWGEPGRGGRSAKKRGCGGGSEGGEPCASPAPEEKFFRLNLKVDSLYKRLAVLYGGTRLTARASQLGVLHLIQSEDLRERVWGLYSLACGGEKNVSLPSWAELDPLLLEVEERLVDLLARRAVEEDIDRKVKEKMEQRYEEYMREIRVQIVKEEGAADNARTLKKLAALEKKKQLKLAQTTLELLRPQKLEEIIGQERAVKALLAKLAAPYPQHILLYGPPGVGKTTSARLALETVKRMGGTVFAPDAPFVEVDGSTLRWDPREAVNPLLGSVHDPIYQGAQRDLAEKSIPEPKLGLVTDAHGGVLFIDEIGEMDLLLQTKLLKVLEEKKVFFESSYYDPDNPHIPLYIKQLFEEGAPADFVLIGATTRDASEISPALRSRCAEIYFEPLSPLQIQAIVREAAARLGISLEPGVAEMISDYTTEGRKATNLLADAYAIALFEARFQGGEPALGTLLEASQAASWKSQKVALRVSHLLEALQASRLSPQVSRKAYAGCEVGRVLGLGVAGMWGTAVEIEAVVFPAREKGRGHLRFNEAAGSMARDSVFNAASLLRRLTGEEIADYDVHINVVGGGRIDGPSAGLAVFLALLSAVKGWGICQDVAVTGEISLSGRIRAVGGVYAKLYGARQAGVRKVILPRENIKEVPPALEGVEVCAVNRIEEVLPLVFEETCLAAEGGSYEYLAG